MALSAWPVCGVDLWSGSPASPTWLLERYGELQIHKIEKEQAIVVIWLPGGLSETYQLACAAGTAPMSYYPEQCLSSSEKRLTLPAAFSIIPALVSVGPRKTMDRGGEWGIYSFKKCKQIKLAILTSILCLLPIISRNELIF